MTIDLFANSVWLGSHTRSTCKSGAAYEMPNVSTPHADDKELLCMRCPFAPVGRVTNVLSSEFNIIKLLLKVPPPGLTSGSAPVGGSIPSLEPGGTARLLILVRQRLVSPELPVCESRWINGPEWAAIIVSSVPVIHYAFVIDW